MEPKIDLKNYINLQIKENIVYFSYVEGLTVVMHWTHFCTAHSGDVFHVREVSFFKHLSETKVQSMMYEKRKKNM